MQKSDSKKAKTARRQTKSSTTLNRRYVKRPAKYTTDMVKVSTKKSDNAPQVSIKVAQPSEPVTQPEAVVAQPQVQMPQPSVQMSSQPSRKITHFNVGVFQPNMQTMMQPNMQSNTQTITQPSVQPIMEQEATQTMQVMQQSTQRGAEMKKTVEHRMRRRSNKREKTVPVSRVTAKELKDQAIKKALAEAVVTPTAEAKTKKARQKSTTKLHFGFGRVLLALSCAAAAVFAIVYFVNLNMPDISLRVAAMQTGINASYPSYVPRDYSVASITSEDGKVTLDFKNANTGDAFTLIEEASSWDSNALLSNYVKGEFGETYSVVREQGLTIYINGSNAAWVNGGVVYKLNTTAGSLTNKQIKSIAVSL